MLIFIPLSSNTLAYIYNTLQKNTDTRPLFCQKLCKVCNYNVWQYLMCNIWWMYLVLLECNIKLHLTKYHKHTISTSSHFTLCINQSLTPDTHTQAGHHWVIIPSGIHLKAVSALRGALDYSSLLRLETAGEDKGQTVMTFYLSLLQPVLTTVLQ